MSVGVPVVCALDHYHKENVSPFSHLVLRRNFIVYMQTWCAMAKKASNCSSAVVMKALRRYYRIVAFTSQVQTSHPAYFRKPLATDGK